VLNSAVQENHVREVGTRQPRLTTDLLACPAAGARPRLGAGAAGLIIGAQSVGAIVVTLLVARRGTGRRPSLK